MGRVWRKIKAGLRKAGRGIAKVGKAVGRFALRAIGNHGAAVGAALGGPHGAALGAIAQRGANAVNDRIGNN